MGGEGGGEHRCEWREKAESLEAELARTRAELDRTNTELNEKLAGMAATLEKLQRQVFGKRSEKIPRVADELRAAGEETDPAAALAKRKENTDKKRRLVARQVEHKVPDAEKICPKCGGHDFSPLGPGKTTELYDLLPALIERQIHIQEKLRCRCGETVLTAKGPDRVYDKARFGPTLMAQVVVAKCADCIPLHRQAKAYQRAGVPMSRSTLTDMFHRVAEITAPLSKRLLEIIAASPIVLADETTIRVQEKEKTRTAWLWDFITRTEEDDKELIAYVFSRTRSGETPLRVLANTTGKLLVDAYSAYNKVTVPGGRERAGCMAHLRRKFFEAMGTAPDAARKAMDFIVDLYRVERIAINDDVYGTPAHLKLRKDHSEPTTIEFKLWLDQSKDSYPPKSPMGEAIHYALAQWDALTLFLSDHRLPIDNNPSERALRVAALGRNYADIVIMRTWTHRAALTSTSPATSLKGRSA